MPIENSGNWRDERALHDCMSHFCLRWGPIDRPESAEFHADLLLLVQQIHRDAMRPVHGLLDSALARQPLQTAIIPKKQDD